MGKTECDPAPSLFQLWSWENYSTFQGLSFNSEKLELITVYTSTYFLSVFALIMIKSAYTVAGSY